MSLPEYGCFAKCVTRPGYRRLLIGLLVALTTYTVGVLLSRSEDRSKVVRTSNSATLVQMTTRLGDVPFPPVTYKYELYPSPEGAAQEFELQLKEAGDYQELRACHDENGTPVGQRAVLINPGRRVNTAGWRMVWTVRSEKSSELFLVESDSLPQLRLFQFSERSNWKPCL